MINIVLEGTIGTGKEEIIKKLVKHYKKIYKIGNFKKVNRSSIRYKRILTDIQNYLKKKKISTVDNRNELILKYCDYIYLRDMVYEENNDINIFNGDYSSICSFAKTNDYYLQNCILEYVKRGQKETDLMVFFDTKVSKIIWNNRKKFSFSEFLKIKEDKKKLKDYIRYNNSEYKLIVAENKESEKEIIEKIISKIDEIFIDQSKSEDDKWYELYKIDIEEFNTPDDYILYKLKYKKKFINKVKKYAVNKNVVEMGCGTGLMAGYLQKDGLNVTALDLSKAVLNYAHEIAEQSNVISPCKYELGDILNLHFKKNTFDVSYSNGVMEHFNDKEIISILKQQLEISKYVIFGIPSTYFNMNEKMLGNERSLTLKEWESLIEKSGGKLLEQTSFHYYIFYRRILEIKKWFKPKAFWLFVIEKNDKV